MATGKVGRISVGVGEGPGEVEGLVAGDAEVPARELRDEGPPARRDQDRLPRRHRPSLRGGGGRGPLTMARRIKDKKADAFLWYTGSRSKCKHSWSRKTGQRFYCSG